MTRKKSRFLAFLWSLVPGAGEMYMGFYKQGISIMAIFSVLLGIAGFLELSFLIFLSPIAWFYSFFHTNNLATLPDEEFYALEDDYLIHWSDITANKDAIKKYRKVLAGGLLFFGISILWNNIFQLYRHMMPTLHLSDQMASLLSYVMRSLPQSVVAIGIIVVGVIMIRNKYEDLNSDDSVIPSPPYLEKKN